MKKALLKELAHKHGTIVALDLADYDALFYRADSVGDFVELRLEAPAAGDYEVVLDWLKYVGRGTFQVSLDGDPLGGPSDLFVPGAPQHTEADLGRVTLDSGPHTFRFTAVRKNAASDNYTFGLCSLTLRRPGQKPQEATTPNRFRQAFPADMPTTLDRDSEVLGPYLPPSKDYEPVLNIVTADPP